MALSTTTPSGKTYTFEMTGLEDVIKKLNQRLKDIENRTLAGIIESAYLVLHDALEITPIDKGGLRASSYVAYKGFNEDLAHLETAIGDKNLMAEIGYKIFYALFVHEIDKHHNPPTQWKFLETSLRNNEDNIIEIIKKRIKEGIK